MQLVLHQDMQGETVEKIQNPQSNTGLQPGVYVVSKEVIVKIEEYLKERETNRDD